MKGHYGVHKITRRSMESVFRVRSWYWYVIILIIALAMPLLLSETYSLLPHFRNVDPSKIR